MYSDFEILKTFLLTLSQSGFGKKGLSNNIQVQGKQVPINVCFDVLRKFLPEEIKQKTNKDILEYLRQNPRNAERLVATHFRPEEAYELMKSLEEKPVTEGTGGQPGAQETPLPADQTTQPAQTTGGGFPSMGLPSVPSISTPRIIIQQPPTRSGMEGGTGQGTAATNKMQGIQDRTEIERVGAATAKANRLSSQTTTLQTETQPAPLRSAAPQRFNFSSFKPPASFVNAAKNFGSRAGVFFQRNAGKYLGSDRVLGFLGKMGNTGINALSGITNFGSGPGGVLSSVGRRFGGGGRIRSFFGGTGGGGVRGGSVIGKAKTRGGLIFAVGLIGFMFLVGGLAAFAPSPTPGGAAPITTPITTGDISNCKFTRGQENPSAAAFQSSTLLSYIQEASQKSTIPPAILAAFIRVESPSTSAMLDNGIKNYHCIYSGPDKNVSETGALGIMQIQPPGTTSLKGDPASCDDCIDAGARLVGKTVSTMIEADYCDARTSIIVGAGWILKKMSYLGYGDGTKWDPAWTNDRKAIEALVNTYYGGVLYPDYTTGPYNYADDVSTSIQNCQITTPTLPPGTGVSCPVTNGYISCASYGTPYTGGGPGAFDVSCAVDSTGNGGHCNTNYQSIVGICLTRTDVSNNLIRTAKSIDVSPSGDTSVYLPTIKGQTLNWIYQGFVNAGRDFGEIRLFKSEPTTDGVWSIHFVHVYGNKPTLAVGDKVQSGAIGAQMIEAGAGTHVHVTIGLNVGDSVSDLKDYSPNWLFADRDLKMCVK